MKDILMKVGTAIVCVLIACVVIAIVAVGLTGILAFVGGILVLGLIAGLWAFLFGEKTIRDGVATYQTKSGLKLTVKSSAFEEHWPMERRALEGSERGNKVIRDQDDHLQEPIEVKFQRIDDSTKEETP